jgi:ribosomal protein S18 acetylase RimI-like enzyme
MNDIPTAREAAVAARAANSDDADAVASTMARAFHDDPLVSFLLRDEKARAANLPRLFKLLFKLGLPYGACDVTSGIEAVALWRPPGHWHLSVWDYVRNGPAMLGIFGGISGALHVMTVLDAIEARHPKEPHWYLQAIGTDTAKQGKGYGGVVIRRHLALADAQRSACYLESSKEQNIPIYQSFGFELTGEIKLQGGPTVWPMWRKPRDG